MTGAAIEVHGLRKAYGDHEAVRGIDFTVRRGEVFGLLGPNGAGKTTTVEVLEGYRERSAGEVRVLGLDPGERSQALRERVGIVLQSCGIYRHLTVREAVAHWASLYPAPRDVTETIEVAGLSASADKRTRTLSGGQQRRLDFALALIGDPELIFLDEPTTGFDPEARRNAWETVRSLRDLGKTVLLTTHYLDEAQALADRVAIIKDGAILVDGPPAELGVGAARYTVSWREGGEVVEHQVEDPTPLLHDLTAAALARGGADLVKDDELLGDPEWCRLAERVARVADVLPDGVLYAANVTGVAYSLLDRAFEAIERGATAIMVNAFAQGLASLATLRAAELGVPLFAHRVGAAFWTRAREFGVAPPVVAELTRLVGADFVQVGSFTGSVFDSEEEVRAEVAACHAPLVGTRRSVAVLGGGVGPANAREQVERACASSGVMVLVGSAGYAHPGGVEEGVRATVEAVAQWR
jgi:ABC-2 type transport system ATP-binding protein